MRPAMRVLPENGRSATCPHAPSAPVDGCARNVVVLMSAMATLPMSYSRSYRPVVALPGRICTRTSSRLPQYLRSFGFVVDGGAAHDRTARMGTIFGVLHACRCSDTLTGRLTL